MVGVTKRFGGITAVDRVDFDVGAGEVHALVGENGAGKSTLMKLLAGLYRPDDGQIEIDGERAKLASPHDAGAAGIAHIPQELELFGELSATENLFVGRPRPRTRWGRIDWGAMQREAERIFDSLGVSFDVRSAAKRLSAANRQLIEIGRALIRDARIVVMDEPTAALTDREAERLFAVIAGLGARGVGIVYISHRLGEVFAVADRITVMRDGSRVRTARAADLSQADVVQLMVGRPLSQLFTREPSAPGELRLEVEGLTRPGSFADVSFTVRRGEIVGIAGLIGAGRTELARAIYGIEPASAGSIRLDGREIAPRTAADGQRLRIGYVPEERRAEGLILPLPIVDNLTFSTLRSVSRLGLVRPAAQRDRAAGLAQRLTVRGAALDAPVAQLSGGNQQKVVVGKVLAQDPSVIVLDEPTRGVDVGAKSEIYRLVDELARSGKAIILISSELAEVLAMSDRILVMHEGRISGAFERGEATQERLAAAATGSGSER